MLIESTLSILAISIAWYAQTIISAFYSAVRGGKLFAEAFFNVIKDQAKAGRILCPGIIGPDFDPNNSVLDEVVGFIIASQGLMFQMTSGFALPFPFNILLAPLNIIEWWIRLQVSSGASTSGGSSE
jgi:hypothetical protein